MGLVWKARGLQFLEFLQPGRLKVWSSKGQHVWFWESLKDTEDAFGEKAGKQSVDIQQAEEGLGHTVVRLVAHLRVSQRGYSQRETSG